MIKFIAIELFLKLIDSLTFEQQALIKGVLTAEQSMRLSLISTLLGSAMAVVPSSSPLPPEVNRLLEIEFRKLGDSFTREQTDAVLNCLRPEQSVLLAPLRELLVRVVLEASVEQLLLQRPSERAS